MSGSRMVLRWILFGFVLTGAIRAFVPELAFQQYFGPTTAGLLLTLLATTLLEVCSEGSSPIAADLLTRAHAPGNAFVFLMAGAATDYTEIASLRQTTRSWKATLALPLISTPQVLLRRLADQPFRPVGIATLRPGPRLLTRRVFWCCGLGKKAITILAITPHP